MRVKKSLFGEIGGQKVYEYSLKNDHDIEIICIDYGCAITAIITPDKQGSRENIVLGFNSLEEYQNNNAYFGVIVGRVAGRIAGGQCSLEGKNCQFVRNNGNNHLHGGLKGFQNSVWKGDILDDEDKVGIRFSYISPDGEDGYPGQLAMHVTYTLNNRNELIISYQGTSDKTTLLNPTNHTYFNLSGNAKRNILQHSLKLASGGFAELDEELIPTGKILSVTGTPFDFRDGRKIIDGVSSKHPQNVLAGYGYDHPFVLNSNHNEEIQLWDEDSGRMLTVETDALGVVLYTGNQLTEDIRVFGRPAERYQGLCLETQGLPDSVHRPEFPSCILEKNQTFSSVTKYTFGLKQDKE